MEYLYKTPIEMPRGTHYGNNYWIFKSRKVGRRVTAFSNLEYENLITLEMDPKVEFYCEQPCEQTVNINGQKHNTIFDVYVVYKGGREEFQEVKYEEELRSDSKQGERSRDQINMQKYWCLQNGYTHNVRTDKDIEIGMHTVRNLSYLCTKACRRFITDTISDNSFIAFLKERPKITVGQLFISGYLSSVDGMDYLADLYYRGIIKLFDIDNEPITNATEVMIYGE